MSSSLISEFNPVNYLYLNPELQAFSNVDTVEKALQHFQDFGQDANLLFEKDELVPEDFSVKVYLTQNSNAIAASDFLDASIKADLFSNNPERLAIIHYVRETFDIPSTRYRVDPFFNENIYRTFQKITQISTLEDLYLDYLSVYDTSNVVIGTFEDFRLAIENYRQSSLNVFSNLNVEGTAFINGVWSSSNLEVFGSLVVGGELFITGQFMIAADILEILGSIRVTRDAFILGVSVFEDTMYIDNFGSGPGLIVEQFGEDENVAEFYVNDAPAMVINDLGNVAIGLQDTTYRLEVDGTARIRSNLEVDGDITLSGQVDLTAEMIIGGDATFKEDVQVDGFIGIGITDGNVPLAPLQIGVGDGDKIVFSEYNGAPATMIEHTSNYTLAFRAGMGINATNIGNYTFATSSPIGYREAFLIDQNRDVFARRNVTVDGTLTVHEDTVLDSKLAVQDDTVIGQTLEVGKTSTFNNPVTINTLDDPTSTALVVNGDVQANRFHMTSDKRVKADIAPVTRPRAKDIINSLRVNSYKLLTAAHDDHAQYGLIGQEVEAVDPSLTRRDRRTFPVDIKAHVVSVQMDDEDTDSTLQYIYASKHHLHESETLVIDNGGEKVQAKVIKVLSEDKFLVDVLLDHTLPTRIVTRIIHDFISVDYLQLVNLLVVCVQELYDTGLH
jgi:hypothetical protein